MIRLLIVDDDDLFVELVKALVSTDDRIQVVARGRNGREGVALAHGFDPDVIVMDVEMPSMDGIEATRRIVHADPSAQVVVFTGSNEPRDEERARKAGATAFVRKSHMSGLLLDAVHLAAKRRGTGPDTARRPTQKLEAVSVPT